MALFGKKTEDKKEAVKVSDSAASSSAVLSKVPSVLVQPRISEKASHLATLNKYVFKVKGDANKVEVKKAVETAYKVKVTQVNIIKNQGKAKTFANRIGRASGFKKAIVTLREGDKISNLTDV